MLRFVRFAVVLVCVGLIAGCSGETSDVSPIPPDKREKAADFTLPGLDGGNVALAQYRGRTVLINFWASWCAPCREEMPAIVAFSGRQKKVAVLGIAVNDDATDSRAFAKEMGMTFPIAVDRGTVLGNYGGFVLPMTVLVGPDGRMVTRHLGPVDDAALRDMAALK